VTGPEEEKKHLRRILDQMESVYWQLIGLEKSQPESLAERVRHEDLSDEMDAATALRTVIACVLNDSIRPALQDLRGVLASTEDDEEKDDEEEEEEEP
jgi:hypothetical protein